MPTNKARARSLLKQFELRTLFIEQLGWDAYGVGLPVTVDGREVALDALAQKRGMIAYLCRAPEATGLPDYAMRRKIERQVAKSAHEHLIVFTDAVHAMQIWQWVFREPGKPAACREHHFHASQPGDALLQKLDFITFSLAEEEALTLVDVARRTRAGFFVERVTKRFYEQFQKEHQAFLRVIRGIADLTDREWYASVMLNRLMFVYFIQRKGFLDGDTNYLGNRLERCRKEQGDNKFYSFYRFFLLRLFHEGLGGTVRSAGLEMLLGRVPYLNGGLFEEHLVEKRYDEIEIPDKAFERVFRYFDQYQWHLDERTLRNDDEINPDVLGYIFEKYINQKEMGAYYTKEDITDYIARNTVIPYILDEAKSNCEVAFRNPGGPSIWDPLRVEPDRYIFEGLRFGTDVRLPDAVLQGVKSLDERKRWNQAASTKYSLPSESWRELVDRRRRYEELRTTLSDGAVRSIDDLVTHNLDIRQFAQDIIENSEGPELLRALWHAVERVTILDPTCGSGAFLFAALNVLEPLYEACLDRMDAFVADADLSDDARRQERLADFRTILERVAAHPNRRYFIFKSIILNNLFGIDLMEEAAEICKLRLFLKLAAQVNPDPAAANQGIEPLPDIDFNIQAGNALIGYASYEEVKNAVTSALDFDNTMERIAAKAADLQEIFDTFRRRQTDAAGVVTSEDKALLRERRHSLEQELNADLAGQYGAGAGKRAAFEKWLRAHRPFHWFIEYHRIMGDGGFDVIIGNPPYAEIPKDVNRQLLNNSFKSALESWSRDEDLCTLIVERSLKLLKPRKGRFGMILPLSVSFSTKRPFVALRKVFADEDGLWLWSHFDRIPSALFGNEVRTRCTIALLSRSSDAEGFQGATTALLRWNTEYRDWLFQNLHFARLAVDIAPGIPKVGSQAQADALAALLRAKAPLATALTRPVSFLQLASRAPDFPQPCVYVGGTAYNWFPAWRDIPETTNMEGRPSLPARTAGYAFDSEEDANIVFALLCSSLGYWWWAVASDGFNLKKWLVERFPLSLALVPMERHRELARLGARLRRDLRKQYVFKDNKGRIGNFYLPGCEKAISAIDECLGSSIEQISPEFFKDIRDFNDCFSRTQATVDTGAQES